ncbi:MAG: phytoene/squalene synthase family protein [Nevskia sp.]|nr:phytoene/squalene synthase family protein [Nevskia sp.]
MNDYRFGASWSGTAEQYQDYILPLVSRTFALTIPQLPGVLRSVVANAYLLCRVADTIEDEPALSAEQKQQYEQAFIEVVAGRQSPHALAAQLEPLLSNATLDSERDLVRQLGLVLRVTDSFNATQRGAIERCIRVMGRGMHHFQREAGAEGLATLPDLDRYCYYVAGVVGELLTELFCDHSPDVAATGDTLRRLAVSFGQGLQMTNILKDQWEDRARGVCWLPRDVFARHGVDAAGLAAGTSTAAYAAAQSELVGVAHAHLRNALAYSLAIPPRETGMRKFCLWAVGLAALTLRNLCRNPAFKSGSEVKVSRSALATTMMLTNLSIRSDAMLTKLFDSIAGELPLTPLAPTTTTSSIATPQIGQMSLQIH